MPNAMIERSESILALSAHPSGVCHARSIGAHRAGEPWGLNSGWGWGSGSG